jgi:signal transduction histidine kinase
LKKMKRNFEVRITVSYLFFGICWILLTDILVETFVADSGKWIQFQSSKGILFVILSAGVIYAVSRHYTQKQKLITKRLQLAREKAEENDRLKSAFLANMSHEIRTPMNGILGFINLIEDSKFSGEKHTLYLDLIKKSSQRMLETINDIIEISQIESNQLPLHFSEVNISESIRFLHSFFLPAAEEKGLEFILTNKTEGENLTIHTDKNKLESILGNLIKNALKFTNTGYIELGCLNDVESVLFYVKDSGRGIAKKNQQIIFDRFVQVDSKNTRTYEGSGLGLTIAKAYVEMLNGKIWLESAEGQGSTFWVSIKIQPAPVIE